MKARNIQLYLIVIALVLAMFFSSSGNVPNIEQRIFIHAIGVDKEDGKYKVSLQAFKAQGSGSDTPVDVIRSNFQLIQSEGETIRDALVNAENIMGRELFLGHLQLICFGKTVDFSDPENLFSFCLKDKNIYLGVKICAAQNTALDLMKTELTRGAMTSESLVNTIKEYTEDAKTINCELIDFLSCIESHQYIAMPVLSKHEPEDNGSDNGNSSGGQDEGNNPEEPQIQINSTALIKDGKILSDELTGEEAEGVNWLTEQAKKSEFLIDLDGKKVSVKLTKGKSIVKLKNSDGKLIVTADLTMVAHPGSDITSSEQSNKLQEQVKKRLERICGEAEQKALYKNKTDIFGVWRMLRHSYPQSYLKYKNDLETVFEATEFRYNFTIRTA